MSTAALDEICETFVGVPRPPYGIATRLRQEVVALPGRRPILVEQVRSSSLPAAVRTAVAEHRPDAVHLEPGWAAGLVAQARPAPTVIATLDAWHLNWRAEARTAPTAGRRLRMAREAARMRRYEATAYAAADALVVVSEHDAEVLRALDPRLAPDVVTNGVDAAAYARPATAAPRDPDTVLFTGAMGFPPNVDAAVFAATEVMPRLRERRPGVRLVLAGRDPAPAVRALADATTTVTGTLDDLRPLLWEAGAYVCPMRTGTGVKNKLLEALAAGAPAVVTRHATGGLGLGDGREALLADTAEDIANALDRVLGDPSLADALGAHGVARATELSWEATAEGYERVYDRVRSD